MKGVLLAGGTGTRLLPLTLVTNKHLLPVYDRPMIYWPLEVFRANKIRQVLVVSGRERLGDMVRLLGSGQSLGFNFTFRVQDEAGGIAQAIGLAEAFVNPSSGDGIRTGGLEEFVVVLGDNIFVPPPKLPPLPEGATARVWLRRVARPQLYGVPAFDGEGRIARIVEKPATPASDFAVLGLYQYRAIVFDMIRSLRPSPRGELEVTDLNNLCADRGGALIHEEFAGYWGDAGASIDGLRRVSGEVAAEMVKQTLGPRSA